MEKETEEKTCYAVALVSLHYLFSLAQSNRVSPISIYHSWKDTNRLRTRVYMAVPKSQPCRVYMYSRRGKDSQLTSI